MITKTKVAIIDDKKVWKKKEHDVYEYMGVLLYKLDNTLFVENKNELNIVDYEKIECRIIL